MSLGSELAPNCYMDLPVGVRFRPTKKERINVFLKHKNMESSQVDGPIPTVDLYDCEPEDLPYKRDFFSRRDRLHGKGKQFKRRTKTGYWKSTCGDTEIIDKDSGQCIGKKKTLVFHTKSGKRTVWTMYEYSQFASLPNQSRGDYAIYFLKKKKTKKGKVETPESSDGNLEIHGQTVADVIQPQLSPPKYDDCPQLSIGEESLLQFANRLFDFRDENFGGNLYSFSEANHQMTTASPHSHVHQRLGLLPNSS